MFKRETKPFQPAELQGQNPKFDLDKELNNPKFRDFLDKIGQRAEDALSQEDRKDNNAEWAELFAEFQFKEKSLETITKFYKDTIMADLAAAGLKIDLKDVDFNAIDDYLMDRLRGGEHADIASVISDLENCEASQKTVKALETEYADLLADFQKRLGGGIDKAVEYGDFLHHIHEERKLRGNHLGGRVKEFFLRGRLGRDSSDKAAMAELDQKYDLPLHKVGEELSNLAGHVERAEQIKETLDSLRSLRVGILEIIDSEGTVFGQIKQKIDVELKKLLDSATKKKDLSSATQFVGARAHLLERQSESNSSSGIEYINPEEAEQQEDYLGVVGEVVSERFNTEFEAILGKELKSSKPLDDLEKTIMKLLKEDKSGKNLVKNKLLGILSEISKDRQYGAGQRLVMQRVAKRLQASK